MCEPDRGWIGVTVRTLRATPGGGRGQPARRGSLSLPQRGTRGETAEALPDGSSTFEESPPSRCHDNGDKIFGLASATLGERHLLIEACDLLIEACDVPFAFVELVEPLRRAAFVTPKEMECLVVEKGDGRQRRQRRG